MYSNKTWTGSRTDVKALAQLQKARTKEKKNHASSRCSAVLQERRACAVKSFYTLFTACARTHARSPSLLPCETLRLGCLKMMTRSLYIAKKRKKEKREASFDLAEAASQPASVEVLHFTSGSCAVRDGSVYHPVLVAKYTVIKLAVCISLFWCCFFLFIRRQAAVSSNLQPSSGPTTEELSAANSKEKQNKLPFIPSIIPSSSFSPRHPV